MTNKQVAIRVINRLQNRGFQALLAGGCVRDMLLGRAASDYDVATDAQPKDVIKLFRRTLKVGAKFGVVIVLEKQVQVEVATFRTETGYIDGRHPEEVQFSNAREDASRRDFTVNGMFYNPVQKEILDYVHGRADLKERLIRTIGKPDERFSEDYLRMLRAVRFSTQLGFAIDSATWSAIRKHSNKISGISGERIAIELETILAHPDRCKGAMLLLESGLAKAIFPSLKEPSATAGIAVLQRLRKRVDFTLALAAFFADCETGLAANYCRVLKLSRNRNRHLKFLLNNRGLLLNEQMSLADLKKILAEPYFRDLYELQRAIQKAGITADSSTSSLIKLRRRIKSLGNVELKPKPLLNGHDLIRLGAVSGPGLGLLAEELYTAQLEGRLRTAEQAAQWTSQWLQKHKQ